MAGTIEYKGEMLTIHKIAQMEGLTPATLKKKFQELGDIYEAIRICKENQQKTYEYKGEYRTLYAIAKIEGLSYTTLNNKCKKEKDIYEAVRKCKENKIIKIPYKDGKYYLSEIAKIEELSEGSLRKYYKETGDIYKAVGICKENQVKKIPYKGGYYYINEIAPMEDLDPTLLMKQYKETVDIEEAVRNCKKNKKVKIPYKDGECYIKEIAKKEEVIYESLIIRYKETGDIYEAVRICKEKQRQKIKYKDGYYYINQIAKMVGINHKTLNSKYIETRDIEKAVFMCKSIKAKREKRNQKIDTKKYGNLGYYDLSLILGIKYSEFKHLIEKGYTVEEIEKMNLKPSARRTSVRGKNNIVLPNGQSLNEYCIENKINYAVIYRAMNVYGRTLEEAVEQYNKHGQQIPTTWIYEKYGVLLKHILLKDGIDISRVISYMRKDYMSLDDAVEKYIIRRNAKKDGLDEDWIEVLYEELSAEEMDDWFKDKYIFDDEEEKSIIKSLDESEGFRRKELLYEISEALQEGIFTPEEEPGLLKMYDITPEEIEIIFNDLYDRFEEPGILKGKEEPKTRTPEEQEKINKKIIKYKQMLEDNNILDIMKKSVAEKVGENQETREEINGIMMTNENKTHN